MPYIAKRADVQTLFEGHPIEHIDISIDTFTGRNLSYCFVKLLTKDDAERGMEHFNGQMFTDENPSRGVYPRPRRSPADFANNVGASWVFEGWERDDVEVHWETKADDCTLEVSLRRQHIAL
ncbi:hypothetical protein F5876DRAFT_78258 [Lentinula aff. lateritia]|uniref:Uncharacterized protein n=1 Tax=Lentinula aff. lateritia TaxID=2804960 RepID=A0ACC1TWP0_9AGAR|nr:hypothetical protein F5876DRAFT_78258 [Lentinula aff. lateritia]